MAAKTPDTAPEPPPAIDPPGASPAEPTAKPVVLATENHITRFVVPGDNGADDLVITHLGVPLSKKRAAEIEEMALHLGVHLIDITPSEKD